MKPILMGVFLLINMLCHSTATDGKKADPDWGPAWAREAVWYQIFPERFRNGDPANDPTLEDLRGGDARHNAADLRSIFNGTAPDAHRDAIAVSAGAMLYTIGQVPTLKAGTERVQDALADGTVSTWLQRHEEADYAH